LPPFEFEKCLYENIRPKSCRDNFWAEAVVVALVGGFAFGLNATNGDPIRIATKVNI
jgi:hypothetical protein